VVLILKIFLLFLVLAGNFTNAVAQDLQLFNPEVLGTPIKSSVKLLLDYKPNNIEPVSVMVDVKDGLYSDVTVQYPREIKFEDARASLNKLYEKYEKKSFKSNPEIGLWRNEDSKYAISLSRDESDGRILIIYLSFRPTDEVFKNILKSMGVNPEEDCLFEDNGNK
jgi:hypothetical protein